LHGRRVDDETRSTEKQWGQNENRAVRGEGVSEDKYVQQYSTVWFHAAPEDRQGEKMKAKVNKEKQGPHFRKFLGKT